ncbi:unnamed protein product [Owenia fusiformis]|uniref:Uncharacterized protein n=1 Tax=Owenia fusiformis TaxID=6347 RepID=A0A8J1UWF7_OWEFU|nr:unnamed protein product [Owenia fusiformis]
MIVLFVLLACNVAFAQKPDLMYEWASLDYDWPDETSRNDSISNGTFIVENNALTGLKLYKGDVFVTVPRWRLGVPSTMNKVITKGNANVLQPYPSWKMQEIGNCSCFQFTQSMEIDPVSGWMWAIDTGRINTLPGPGEGSAQNLCPAKLVIIDIAKRSIVRTHIFPEEVVSKSSNFLNDIVVDPKGGFAYISDAADAKMVVYNYNTDRSHSIKHISMGYEPDAILFTINNKNYTLRTTMDGIALSPDRSSIFYCALAGFSLYSISTKIANDPNGNHGDAIRKVGVKVSQSDGLVAGYNNLYYGVLGLNGLYKWEISKDMREQSVPYTKVNLTTRTEIYTDDVGHQWVDTFALEESGEYLWYTANKLQDFFPKGLDFSGGNGSNFRIWKVKVNDRPYILPTIENSANCNYLKNVRIMVALIILVMHI